MRKEYLKPALFVETFTANEFVSACYIPKTYTYSVTCEDRRSGLFGQIGNVFAGHQKCENNTVVITMNANGISNIRVTEIQTGKFDNDAQLDGNKLTWNVKNNNQKFEHTGILDFSPETTNHS